ncbi:hypothetical protein [Oceanicoccus sp. KOV_DT_Chl]|uniref:hypothetical protein n=1 Tax=Oceanicoccus sp. KOV_DT_Chl TaxID=1904639 RepID=UPI0011AEE0D9|nr:hypothetical protein [Oceanicoccus sp. KOV_DT_Chl]
MLRLFALFHFMLLMVSCNTDPAEQQILQNIELMESAVESKDASDVLDHLAEGFVANEAMDKKQVEALMRGYFFRYPAIELVSSNINVELNPNDPNRAVMAANLIVAGGNTGLLPDRASGYKLEGEWQIERGEWRLIRLTWDR